MNLDEFKSAFFVLALFLLAGIMCLFGIMYALFAILAHLQRNDSNSNCEVNVIGK